MDGESSATAGSDAKEGIDNHERTESVSTCTTALRDGESGISVIGESSATTVSDAKEGIENHQRTTSASRLDDCLARWRERYERPMWTARAKQWRRLAPKKGFENRERKELVST